MRKSCFKILCSIIIMLVLIITLSACTETSEPDYAGPITEGILIGMNEEHYAKFSEHFDEDMIAALPEANFEQLTTSIKSQIGDYVPDSKEFDKIITSDIYTDVFYKARFTKGYEFVVHVSFHESDGEIYVNGFWLEEP
jgi:hypothetical protein